MLDSAHHGTSSSLLARSLPFAEIQVRARFLAAGRLPDLRGVSLRGGMGYHLRKTICHVPRGDCRDCILRSDCVYTFVFEGVAPAGRDIMRLYPYVPQPFVIVTKLGEPNEIEANQEWEFGLRLFGQAIHHFPYLAYALMEIGKEGLGRDEIPFEIEKIAQSGIPEPVYESGSNRIGRLKPQFVDPSAVTAPNGRLTLEFVTPARLRVAGKEAQVLTFGDFIRAASRRLSILTHFYGTPVHDLLYDNGFLERAASIATTCNGTRWFQFRRFSGRQRSTMTLGGLIGKISFMGDLASFLPLLELVRIAHIGKATSFGFGRIAVSER